jgi:uncharacterized damage-inducible protein DinB
MDAEARLRKQLERLLEWEDAHVSFDAAVDGIAPRLRGSTPAGLPHSPWQLLEHLRRTQRDILEFCVSAHYASLKWPEDYWPPTAAPASDMEWEGSVAAFARDREALQRLARDPATDLHSRVPNGDGQTYLRELLLAADHTSYHVGQMILVRRALGIWT